MAVPSMPFTVLALAPFNPVPESSYRPQIVTVVEEGLDQAFSEIGPSLSIPVPQHLCPEGRVDLHIRSMKDFHPDGLVQATPFLKNISEALAYIKEAAGAGAEEIYQRLKDWPDLPIEISYEPGEKRQAGSGTVDNILSMVASPGGGSGGSGSPQAWASSLTEALEQCVWHIFNSDVFRTHESAWRGAEFMLKRARHVRLKLVSVSAAVLEDVLDHLQEELMDDPPSLILVDLGLDSSTRGLDLLDRIAALGESMLAPVFAWIGQGFFHLSKWSEFSKLSYIPHFLDEASFAKWRRLCGLPAANWMGVLMNRFLARHPYGPENKPRTLSLEEPGPLWIGPVWALGALMGMRVKETGWPTRFSEYNSTFLEDMPVHGEEGGARSAVELEVPTDRIGQLQEAGIMTLVGPSNKDTAFIAKAATAAGGSINYQLVVSRLIGILLRLRDEMDQDLDASAVGDELRSAFVKVWESTGHDPPDDLEVSAEETGPGAPLTVSVRMTPPKDVLPSGEKVELTLNW